MDSTSTSIVDGLRQRREGVQASGEDSATQPRSRIPSKQQIMLRQMRAHRQVEAEETHAIMKSHENALSDLVQSYLKVLAVIVIFGFSVLFYVAPDYFRDTRPKLPTRNLMMLYPSNVQVKQLLPRFYGNYAIATGQNLPAREVLRRVAAVRNVASDASGYRQKVILHTFEHADLERQLPADEDKDAVCGSGFALAYRNFAGMNRARDDLILFCLMKLGTHDGMIKWNTTVQDHLTRGIKGLAAKYINADRIHSSILLLPLLSQYDFDRSHEGGKDTSSGPEPVEPSTMLPSPTLEWIIDRGSSVESLPRSEDEYVSELEEFLYEVVAHERASGNWVILDVGCTVADRDQLDAKERRVATTCSTKTFPRSGEDDATCCSYYDPTGKPFVRAERRA